MVTPLQLARGMCSYANGGRLVKPRIVKGVLDATAVVVSRAQGRAEAHAAGDRPAHGGADQARAVRRGHSRARPEGAIENLEHLRQDRHGHISRGKGGYSDEAYTSSFIGGARPRTRRSSSR
jgi:membrane carboxypeptidase/penicillin-binding protein